MPRLWLRWPRYALGAVCVHFVEEGEHGVVPFRLLEIDHVRGPVKDFEPSVGYFRSQALG